jgi:AraC family transcriptional regulator of adaptative response / DNA-3-methyladenine glycosylase II
LSDPAAKAGELQLLSQCRLRLVTRPGISNGTGQETGFAASLTFVLPYRPPYDFDGLLKFLRDRAIPGVESVDETGYRRILRVTKLENGKAVETLEKIGWVEVTHRPARHALELRCDDVFSSEVRLVLARTKQAFDLDADPAEIDRVLGALATNTPGVHLPGTFDPFELAIRAILGQQVTVKAARTLVTRFVAALGTPISTTFVDLNQAFPSVHHIAGLDPAVIASLGIVRQRAEAIISLANAIGSGAIELAPTAEPTQTIELLCGIRGIGPWTAHYIAMRALAWRDAWLPGDVALQNALGLPNTARGIRAAHDQANEWRPWRSYAVLKLWLRGSIGQAPSVA